MPKVEDCGCAVNKIYEAPVYGVAGEEFGFLFSSGPGFNHEL